MSSEEMEMTSTILAFGGGGCGGDESRSVVGCVLVWEGEDRLFPLLAVGADEEGTLLSVAL